MTPLFKELIAADIPSVAVLMQDFYAIDQYPFDTEKSIALFHQFLSDENLGKAWLISDGNEPIGYMILTFVFSFEYGGRIGFLDELFLCKKARGKGIGKTALRFVQEEALKLKLKIIYLELEGHNEKAQKLYLAHDFTQHHRNILKYIVK
jgi:GNAT superfamily N-acetyltransferase